MKRRVLIGLCTLALAAMLGLPRAKADGPTKVLFITKSGGFQHSVVTRHDGKLAWAEQILTDLGAKHGYEVTCIKDCDVVNADYLKPYAVIAMYTQDDLCKDGVNDKSKAMSKEGKQALIDAVEAGTGLIGFHCASDTCHSPGNCKELKDVDPYIRLIGGEFAGHGAQQSSSCSVLDAACPGFGDLGKYFAFKEEWYTFRNLARDQHALLLQHTDGMEGNLYAGKPNYPSTWARTQGKGRIFYTSMGHREDVWTTPAFQTVAISGLNWVAGRTKMDTKPNIMDVAPDAAMAPAQ